MTDLTVLVDQVAERHYLERCKQLTDPQPAWDDLDPMVRHRLREWVLPTVNATVDLMVEAMKQAVAEERERAAEAMKSRDDFMRILWIIVNRTPDGVNISEDEIVTAPHDVTLRSSDNPITHGILIEAIESGAHDA